MNEGPYIQRLETRNTELNSECQVLGCKILEQHDFGNISNACNVGGTGTMEPRVALFGVERRGILFTIIAGYNDNGKHFGKLFKTF